jgi:polyisoprenoid-binding protein YceI
MVKILSSLSLLVFSLNVLAVDWNVDNSQSTLSFVSVKKGNVAEVHQFKSISGQMANNGEFKLDIALESVNTGIDVRDSRMREFLFDVVTFPTATLTAKVEPNVIEQVTTGETMRISVDAMLSLHGQTQPLTLDVLVTKLTTNSVLVVAAKPVVLNVADFDLVNGVEKLRELAGLPSISHAVPVSFYLTLNAM